MPSPRRALALGSALLLSAGCVPTLTSPPREADTTTLPAIYAADPAAIASGVAAPDSTQTALTSDSAVPPREFFPDPQLIALIEEALAHNQELNIVTLETRIVQSEVLERQGEYLPKLELRGGAGVEREWYEEQVFKHGLEDVRFHDDEVFEDVGSDYLLGVFASWELDIWGKLRDAKSAAVQRYLSSLEGRRFAVTNLVAEVADAYYELLALDNQLLVLSENIAIQRRALEIVRLQKQAGRTTELAVKRFQAEVLKNQSRLNAFRQRIVATENRLNVLVGRYPQPIARDASDFITRQPRVVQLGKPDAILDNRPDVKRAEFALAASKLDVQVAKARFYPALELNAGVAVRAAFDLAAFPSDPWSLVYGIAAEFVQPLVNRKALEANYLSANAAQMQAVFEYERAILTAYTEVVTQLARVGNLEASFALKRQEVARLEESIEVSARLFRSARADYGEVLLTRRDALDAELELIETRASQMQAMVRLYRAIGGGWR